MIISTVHRWIAYFLVLATLLSVDGYAAPLNPFRKKHHHGHHHSQRRTHKGVTIVIDPGHGGKDSGASSLGTPKYFEKYLALTTSLMLRNHLSRMGYKTILTRRKDEFIALQKRAEISNKSKGMLFISVHYNAATNRKAHGVEVFYYNAKSDDKRSVLSKALAQHVLDRILQSSKANNRGVKHGNFCVIRETRVPAILVEGGFLTNDAEVKKLKNPKYQNKIAWGIAQGINDYIKKK